MDGKEKHVTSKITKNNIKLKKKGNIDGKGLMKTPKAPITKSKQGVKEHKPTFYPR